MTRFRLMLNMLAVAVVCVLFSSLAHAQGHVYVSGVGNDANPCTRTAPCATFQTAVGVVAAGGEVHVVDTGNYGGVAIFKAVTINGDGVQANADIIEVAAGVNDVVRIRGISIGEVSGPFGIKYVSGKRLEVENCSIYNANSAPNGFGIWGTNSDAGQLVVTNTLITNCTIGIRLSNAAGNTASISKVNIEGGEIGVEVVGGTANISDSVISHQSAKGLVAQGSAALNVANCRVSNNGQGVVANTPTSRISISNCEIYNNSTGVIVGGFFMGISFYNNKFIGNGTNVQGFLFPGTIQ